jgi:hypothetical protein
MSSFEGSVGNKQQLGVGEIDQRESASYWMTVKKIIEEFY